MREPMIQRPLLPVISAPTSAYGQQQPLLTQRITPYVYQCCLHWNQFRFDLELCNKIHSCNPNSQVDMGNAKQMN